MSGTCGQNVGTEQDRAEAGSFFLALADEPSTRPVRGRAWVRSGQAGAGGLRARSEHDDHAAIGGAAERDAAGRCGADGSGDRGSTAIAWFLLTVGPGFTAMAGS
jgi:hypothetical protein